MPLIDNPFGNSNPFGHEDWTGLGISRKRQPAFKPLPEPESESLKDSLVNKGATGLQWVGQTLDKAFGARALRGAAVGDWNEAKSIIPFSDTLGITDVKNSHSMDEVLQHHNLVKENDPDKWEARDFLVPAAEIAADPGTYLSFGGGALTRLGKLAKNANVLPKGLRAGMQGFHGAETALRAAGATDEVLAHAARSGQRIAPSALTAAAGTADVAGKPLKGLVGVGLPFMDPAFTFGHGKWAQKAAGALDAAGDAVKFSAPGRAVRGLFDPDAGRSFDRVAQQASEVAGRPTTKALQSEVDRMVHQSRFGLEPIVSGPGVPAGVEREATRLLRQRGENIAQAGDHATWRADLMRRHAAGLAPGVADPVAVANHIQTHWDTLADMGDRFNRQGKDWLDQAAKMGLKATDLGDANADYLMRQYITAKGGVGGGANARVFNAGTASDLARKKFLRDIPGGTEAINQWAIDPRLSGAARTLSGQDVRKHILNEIVAGHTAAGGLVGLTPEALAAIRKQSGAMSSWLGKLDDLHAQHGIPVFDPDTIAAMASKGQRQAKAIGNATAMYEGLARGAVPASAVTNPAAYLPLDQALAATGLKTLRPFAPLDAAATAELATHGVTAEVAREAMRDSTHPLNAAMSAGLKLQLGRRGYDGAAARLYEQMARHGAPMADLASGLVNPNATLARHFIPRDQLGKLTEMMQGWAKPHEVAPILSKLDSANNLFKNLAYPMWPASHVRNYVSALYNNAIHGTPIQAYLDAAKVAGGKGIGDVAAYAHLHPNWSTMTDAGRGQLLHELAYAHGKVFQGAGGANELVGRHGLEPIAEKMANGERMLPHVPGDNSHIFGERGVLAQAQARGKGSLNPLGQAGLAGRQEDTFAPLVLGRRAGTNIEDHVRLSAFLGGLRKGMNPEAAGDLVSKLHFDYSDLTRFEKEGMRRLFPFYTYMRKNLPYQAGMLARTPNKMVPAIKALTNVDGNRDAFTPEYLSSGVAIPMGKTTGPDGKEYDRYFNKVGLPFEEALERLKFREYQLPGGFKASLPAPMATAMAYLGGTTPYLKGPLEAMTNTQFHTGRKLSDLHSEGLWGGYGLLPQEYAQPLTQLMANSPLTRVGSSVDKLVDPRKTADIKAMNLLTGFGVTDVDTEKMRNIEARKEAEATLMQDPSLRKFENIYVKPGQKGELSPEAVRLMRLYTGMKDEAKSIADERKRKEAAEKYRQLIGQPAF